MQYYSRYRFTSIPECCNQHIRRYLRMFTSKMHRFVFGAQFKFIIAFEFTIHRRESITITSTICSIVQFIPLTP